MFLLKCQRALVDSSGPEQWSPSVPPEPPVSESPRNLLEMQILRPHSRLVESETLGVSNVFSSALQAALMLIQV